MNPQKWSNPGNGQDVVVTLGSSTSNAAPSPLHAPALEIAHVLFVDVVGFSRLRMNQQALVQQELQQQLQALGEVVQARQAGKLIIRPTGDGAALLFLRDMLSPLRCAIQLQTVLRANGGAIRARTGTLLHLRMGIHTGPVYLMEDLNSQSDVAGEGIILAQRVMDCGDSGHILLSAEYAGHLKTLDPWSRYLSDIGPCPVKHGITIHLYNFHGKFDGYACGNPSLPERVRRAEQERLESLQKQAQRARRTRRSVVVLLLPLFCLGGGYGLWNTSPAVRQSVTRAYQQVVKTLTPTPPKPVTAKPTRTAQRPKPSPTPRSLQRAGFGTRDGTATPLEERVTVPELSGLTFDEAREAAEEASLQIVRSVNSDYNSEYEAGLIYQQSPAPGSQVRPGKTVYVRVSKGDPSGLWEEMRTFPR